MSLRMCPAMMNGGSPCMCSTTWCPRVERQIASGQTWAEPDREELARRRLPTPPQEQERSG